MYVWTTECLEHGYSVVLNHFVLHLFSIVDTQKVIRDLEGTVQNICGDRVVDVKKFKFKKRNSKYKAAEISNYRSVAEKSYMMILND